MVAAEELGGGPARREADAPDGGVARHERLHVGQRIVL